MPELITGASGQLGLALQTLLPDAVATDSSELDITDAGAVKDFDWSEITAIYNAAAYTNVDGAETETVIAEQVNHIGPSNLALIAREKDIPFIHVSTDYVFDGTATEPYTIDEPLNPQSVYGKTKAAGEEAATLAPKHYIVRTSWVYGEGNNFVRTMLKLGSDPERHELTVVSDQIGRPTYAVDLAKALIALVSKEAEHGIYHATNSGEPISWADFASKIFELTGTSCAVKPISTKEYVGGKTGIAPRPAYGVLDLSKLESAGVSMPDWEASLAQYLSN